MELSEWKQKLKQCKRKQICSGKICNSLKVYSVEDYNLKKIVFSKECYHCKHVELKELNIVFKENHNLTIFETAIVFSIFIDNFIPMDYANYHKCQAGKEFIENIHSIDVL